MRIKLVVLLFVTAASLISPQSKHSFQITGGIIMPLSSSRGLMTNLQYNYQYNSRYSFYLYTGYGAWDQFKIQYIAEAKPGQKQMLFETAYADEHKMIPLGAGAKMNFHSTNWLTTFVSMELNYAHLSYIRPKLGIAEDTSGIVIGFGGGEPRTRYSENLVGLALGVGLSHPVTSNADILFSYKFNSFFNMKDYSFLTNRATYSAISAGFTLHI